MFGVLGLRCPPGSGKWRLEVKSDVETKGRSNGPRESPVCVTVDLKGPVWRTVERRTRLLEVTVVRYPERKTST